jgi:UDP-N-acetylmuramyl pentapeptide phosphotransferase/UDP-N-acetylglucosamine-1-phosphate transferase
VIFPFSIVFGDRIELGPFYLLYITCLGIYKTNTINIFAGINGLEVGQSIVAAIGMLLYFGVQVVIQGAEVYEQKEYSVSLLVVFLGGALALLKLNQYPSQIFIGDTFCYFAGIVLAIAAILGTLFYRHRRDPGRVSLVLRAPTHKLPLFNTATLRFRGLPPAQTSEIRPQD